MVTLKHAFDASSMKGLILKILRGTYPEIPKQYSKDLKDLISSMLIKDPVKRPSINKVLEMSFLQKRVKKLFLNATSKYELEVDALGSRVTTEHSTQLDSEERKDRQVLKDRSNSKSKDSKNKVFKNYINFKKASKKPLKIVHSQEECKVSQGKENNIKGESPREEEKVSQPLQKFLQNIPGVCASDSQSYRIEALRVYLEDKLGDEDFIKAYNYYLKSSKLDDKVEEELEVILGPKRKYVGLIYQLIVCEDSYYRNSFTKE